MGGGGGGEGRSWKSPLILQTSVMNSQFFSNCRPISFIAQLLAGAGGNVQIFMLLDLVQ